jgi:hypothetical protein
MERKRSAKRPRRGDGDDSASVESFLAALDHPHTPAIVAIRECILAADPSIGEGIKWNAPSFRTTEYFATVHLRTKEGVGVILHLGAKKRELPSGGLDVEDPRKMLTWLGKDRALVTFRDAADVAARRAAFIALVRRWIEYV